MSYPNQNPSIAGEAINTPLAECDALLETDILSPTFPWDLKELFERNKFRPEIIIPMANRVFAKIKTYDFPKKSKSYSLLLDIFLMVKARQRQPWRNFTDFMDWWGFENFSDEDYLPIELKNRRKLHPLAERAYGRYYKSLLAKLEHEECTSELTEKFIGELQSLKAAHPEYPFIPHHLARLQLMLGRKKDAQLTILPLARLRHNEFWVWDVLADTVDDPWMALSCCCRGLLCRVDPKFLVKLRIKAAKLMHQLGFDGNAKAEIRQWHKTYDFYGWKFPPEVISMVKSDWYHEAEPPVSNRDFYLENMDLSEQLIFAEMPEQPILITGVNTQKGLVNYITADRRTGFFFNRAIKTAFSPNTVYLARLEDSETPGRASRLVTHRRDHNLSEYLGIFFSHFSGELRIYQNGGYGFVDDVYVNARLITPDMTPGMRMSGTASLTYNFKKQDFNPIAISLMPEL